MRENDTWRNNEHRCYSRGIRRMKNITAAYHTVTHTTNYAASTLINTTFYGARNRHAYVLKALVSNQKRKHIPESQHGANTNLAATAQTPHSSATQRSSAHSSTQARQHFTLRVVTRISPHEDYVFLAQNCRSRALAITEFYLPRPTLRPTTCEMLTRCERDAIVAKCETVHRARELCVPFLDAALGKHILGRETQSGSKRVSPKRTSLHGVRDKLSQTLARANIISSISQETRANHIAHRCRVTSRECRVECSR